MFVFAHFLLAPFYDVPHNLTSFSEILNVELRKERDFLIPESETKISIIHNSKFNIQNLLLAFIGIACINASS